VNYLFVVRFLLLFFLDVAGGAIVLLAMVYNNNLEEELKIMKTLHLIKTLKLPTHT
jgi:hypothetical protein